MAASVFDTDWARHGRTTAHSTFFVRLEFAWLLTPAAVPIIWEKYQDMLADFLIWGVPILGLGLLGGWLLLGKGPRRARALHHAERLLEQRQWPEALALVAQWKDQGQPSERLQALESRCRHAAGEDALAREAYEEAVIQMEEAARLARTDAALARRQVLEAMLAHLRRLFSQNPSSSAELLDLLERITRLAEGEAFAPVRAEAVFWHGLHAFRQGDPDAALVLLDQAHQLGQKRFIDPPFYRGLLLHRKSQHREALMVLAEANRVDPSCPFVTWQIGLSMSAAGTDAGIALKTLDRALGPRGLPLWKTTPQRAWIEAFPRGSFVRRLAEERPFCCPLLGSEVRPLLHQAELARAGLLCRLERFEEAVEVYNRLLQDMPPSLPLVRGLGLALTRLERYDLAYKHLRAAVDLAPDHPLTVASLALCAARGRPTHPDDKPKNVAWALRQLTRFLQQGDAELARVAALIHEEALESRLSVSLAEQQAACLLLAQVEQHDVRAARIYARLAREFPSALTSEMAWLYCRACQENDCWEPGDLPLFVRTIRERERAEPFFRAHGWDFGEIEYLFLERLANHEGERPAGLAGLIAHAKELLLERSRRQESAGDLSGALRTIQTLSRLEPGRVETLDRLACLRHRTGRPDLALETLQRWQRQSPGDPLPLLRQAVLERGTGRASEALITAQAALELAQGQQRISVALLGARLALAAVLESPASTGQPEALAQHFLQAALAVEPDHPQALWQLAALRCLMGESEKVAELARRLDRAGLPGPEPHYFAAVGYLQAGDPDRAFEPARRAAQQARDEATYLEARYLLGLVLLRQGRESDARTALSVVAGGKGPTAEQARAVLGLVCFRAGDYDGALQWWNLLNEKMRRCWCGDETWRTTHFLAGLKALHEGRDAQAAERFREAGKLGLRERSLGSLIGLALFRAGRRLLTEL